MQAHSAMKAAAPKGAAIKAATPPPALEARSAGIRPLDLVHLSRQTLGDRALEVELLGLFDKQAGQIIARLDSDLCASDRKWRHDLSHTLKGSARAIGAVRIAATAQSYEDALAAGLPDGELKVYVEALKGAVEEAQAEIRSLLADS